MLSNPRLPLQQVPAACALGPWPQVVLGQQAAPQVAGPPAAAPAPALRRAAAALHAGLWNFRCAFWQSLLQ